MTDSLYAVYGVSGFGREVMPIARDVLNVIGDGDSELVFVDDNPKSDSVNGHRVYKYDEFIKYNSQDKYISIAIADATIRSMLTEQCVSDGINIWSLSSTSSLTMDQVEISEGSILCSNVTITSNVIIGKSFHANINSYVAHDCKIGDYVTFAPGVMCNGNVVVEDYAYIGTGAIIRQGRPDRPIVIGKGATVGMGAVVTKNVKPNTTVIGNPATLLSRKSLKS